MVTKVLGGNHLKDDIDRNIKRVKISQQRQISIPKDYYDSLGLENEVFLELIGNTIVLRPVTSEVVDFSEYILKDVIKEGYTGYKILERFKEVKSQIPTALDRVIEEAEGEAIVEDNLDEYLDSIDDDADNE